MFFFIILSGYQNLDFLFSTVYMYIRFFWGFFWSCKFCENEVNLLCSYFCGPLYFIVLFFWCNKRRIIAQNGSPLTPTPTVKTIRLYFDPFLLLTPLFTNGATCAPQMITPVRQFQSKVTAFGGSSDIGLQEKYNTFNETV